MTQKTTKPRGLQARLERAEEATGVQVDGAAVVVLTDDHGNTIYPTGKPRRSAGALEVHIGGLSLEADI